jgi:hypothetical protein
VGQKINAQRVLMRIPEEKTHMKNPGVDRRIILKLNLKN